MIACNLSVLLAEKNLKITTVSQETGISRTTLTSLANNYSGGIQFETLNSLCVYLNTTPEQLFIFSPFDLSVEDVIYLEDKSNDIFDEYIFRLFILFNFKNKNYRAFIDINSFFDSKLVGSKKIYTLKIEVCFEKFIKDIKTGKRTENIYEKNVLLSNTIKNLPVILLTNIENIISTSIVEKIKEISSDFYNNSKYNISITWNFL